jgi:sulfopropanediol 3-dehydrogenase
MIYLKQALTKPETDHQDVRDLVQVMLARIALQGEEAVRD